jgi:hypothetical protein
MARIKKCLDESCQQFIYLDNGTTIVQPRTDEKGKLVCDLKHVPNSDKQRAKHKEDWDEIAKGTKKTIYVSETLFKDAKEGKEIDL